MPDWLNQIQNLFSQMPTFLLIFFVFVGGFIALMFVLVFLRILWTIIRLIFGIGSRRYSLDNNRSNSDWRYSMNNPMNPNSPLNPNNPLNPNSPINPHRRWGHSMNNPMNPNSPLNPNNPLNPNSPMNPHRKHHH
jgi:hypothetical protein